MISNNQIRFGFFDVIFILFFAFFYVMPSIGTINIVIILVICMIYILTVEKMTFNISTIKYIILFAAIATMYLLFTESGSMSSYLVHSGLKRWASKFYQLFMMFFPMFLFSRLKNGATKQMKKMLLFVSLGILTYVVINSIIYLRNNPGMARAWGQFSELQSDNLGTFYFVYALPILITVIVWTVCQRSEGYIKFILITYILLQVYFLFLAEYTISLIMMLLGMLIVLIMHKVNTVKTLLILCVGLPLIFLTPTFLQWLSAVISSENISARLVEMAKFLSGGGSTGDLDGRFELYKNSIIDFLHSPIIGNRQLSYDPHSTFLSVLADLGLMGGIPFYYLYFHSRKIMCDLLNQKSLALNMVFTVFIITGVINPIHAGLPIMFVMWFIVPLIIDIINENNGEIIYAAKTMED